MRGGPGKLPVLDLLGARALRLTLTFTVSVNERVRQDPEQPGLEIRSVLILVERPVCLSERFLYQILSVRRMTSHPHGRRVQLIQVRQDIALEAIVALLECLRYLTHLLQPAQPIPA